MVADRPEIKDIVFSVLNSYSQVFFSTSKLLAVLLMGISFFDYGAGLGGLLAVIIANMLAWILGYNKYSVISGLYGFNALLTGLGIGLFYQPSLPLYLFITVAAIACFFMTIVFQGVLGKYGLPFLSVPFLVSIWLVALSGNSLTMLQISERGIYLYNELYALGGKTLVDIYETLETSVGSSFIGIYFYSLGAIFFQFHLPAGIIIAIGLLLYSRISFVLSLLGFSIAYAFYQTVGIEFNSLSYTFIGFNYILTAIALGGYYLVPNRESFGWIALLLPVVVLITIGLQAMFQVFKISPYSLPFNVVVLMFLYALKLREKGSNHLIETPIQLGKPERNFYLYSGNTKRFPAAFPVSFSLPFFSEWTINQAHNGSHTHQGEWRHAWDFVITDQTARQFRNRGDFKEDYFCFGKVLVAPADGTVIQIINNIPDNTIGDINTRNNWGNTVVIKHSENLYSKLCHLQCKSIELDEGDQVKQGQLLGRCGNSGRSPYPHLHFQFQATPYIGSVTIDYPIGHYLQKTTKGFSLKTFKNPGNNEHVANPSKNEILTDALHFIPGQRMKVRTSVSSDKKKWKKLEGEELWLVETDAYNNTYIRSESETGRSYLYNNDNLHYFTNYTGKRNTVSYWFFIALFKIPLGFLPHSMIEDSIPVNMMYGGALKILQDFMAPFILFLKADYRILMKEAGDILSSGDIEMEALVTKKLLGKNLREYKFEIRINQQNEIHFQIGFNHTKIKVICINDLA